MSGPNHRSEALAAGDVASRASQPALARRSFLAALPAIFGAAAAAAAPLALAEAHPEISPEIAALATTVASIEVRYVAAAAELQAALDEWSPQWPLAPETICLPWVASICPAERDLAGNPILRDGRTSPYGVRTMDNMERIHTWAREAVEDKKAKLARGATKYRLKELARTERTLARLMQEKADRDAYGRECRRILDLSRVEALTQEKVRAAHELVQAVRSLLQATPVTGADVGAMAAAAASLASLQGSDRMCIAVADTRAEAEPMILMLARAVAGAAIDPQFVPEPCQPQKFIGR